jgi:hypothetical protein
MLYAFFLTLLLIISPPALAGNMPETGILAQEQQTPRQAPKRDCEKREEGVSA